MQKLRLALIFLSLVPVICFSETDIYAQLHASADDCGDCHYSGSQESQECTSCSNLTHVRCEIGGEQVVFTGPYVTGEQPYGICEVCHTETDYHNNTGDGVSHYNGGDCLPCHRHQDPAGAGNMFAPEVTGPQSHNTHFQGKKGPQLQGCYYPQGCHTRDDPYFNFGPAPGQDLASTNMCDYCHSPGGPFNGVGDLDPGNPDSLAFGAKLNWLEGVYTVDGTALKAGKEQWCSGCHDRQLGVPGSESEIPVGQGKIAPGVVGDHVTYGYWLSGHGQNWSGGGRVYCDGCHDFELRHLDNKQRTYEAALDNYQAGYRLRGEMKIPRDENDPAETSFSLCMDLCHDEHDSVFSPALWANTHFRIESDKTEQLHEVHLTGAGGVMNWWDSDWSLDFVGNLTEDLDSSMSCPACHNVHGSPSPVMIRHGELTSTPGTEDKVPGLDFFWDGISSPSQPLGDPVTELMDSRRGWIRIDALDPASTAWDANGICKAAHCHPALSSAYVRIPGGYEEIVEMEIWTSDWEGNPKDAFFPSDEIRYNLRFVLTGAWDVGQWWVQTGLSGGYSEAGDGWQDEVSYAMYVPRSETVLHTDSNIPGNATPGDAHYYMDLYMGDHAPPDATVYDHETRNIPFVVLPLP
ncbi:MAG: hypothetical protein SWQ30_03300 [Thermodesulfobacteriota bacterium]|nr:hypothetical protein [Thermodesulfobacteriota bacterium]